MPFPNLKRELNILSRLVENWYPLLFKAAPPLGSNCVQPTVESGTQNHSERRTCGHQSIVIADSLPALLWLKITSEVAFYGCFIRSVKA